MFVHVADNTSPRIENMTMIRKPMERSQRFRTFATGMYVAAPMTLDTVAMTGSNECDSKSLVM